MSGQLLLVDGSSYLHRAYHALSELTGPDGRPTGAIYGVVGMLKSLLATQTPDYFAVVFDPPGKTFRHEIYPEYKAHRPPTPQDLKQQFEVTRRIIEALGYPVLQYKGIEADDVIGTLARRGANKGFGVLISTGDKDLAQLVSDKVRLIDTMKKKGGALTDSIDAVKEKFGVRPDQIADYLALAGDASDGIPGVAGVGPKTAAKWLGSWETLAGVMENAAAVKGKAGEALQAAQPMLETYRRLTTIYCDLDLDRDPESLTIEPADVDELRGLYEACGFRSWLADLAADDLAPDEAAAPFSACRLILTEASLRQYLEKLGKAGRFALDVAADDGRVAGIALAASPGDAVYLPLAHDYPGAPRQLPSEQCVKQLAPLLQDAQCAKCGCDVKRIMHALEDCGVTLRGVEHDSMLASYVHDSVATDHDVNQAAGKYLGLETVTFESIAGKGVKQKPASAIAVKTAGDYWAQRAAVSLQLKDFLLPRLERDKRARVYREIELPLVPVLAAIERKGVLIDGEALARQGEELEQGMHKTQEEAFALAGAEFNISSPKQIQSILYEQAGLPVLKKTPGGQPSTAEEVLQQLAGEFDLPRLILEHRALSKLKLTYTDKLPLMVNPNSGRVHTSYHQAVTATGRLSSSSPNLQNIPVRTPAGRRIRRAFIAADGHRLVAVDYSQIEMRIMAHLSGDAALLEGFAGGDDVHTTTAAEVFECPVGEVNADQRRIAKAINFGLIYGMSAYGLARQLNLSRTEAAKYVKKYFERYPAVRDYMDKMRALAHEQGFVETIFGRRLYLPDLKSRNPALRRYAERTAINAPMQGSAADIIKRAMTDIHHSLPAGASIIMQVHDELVLEVPQDKAAEVAELCREKMNRAAELKLPLATVAGIGDNWDEAH